MPEEILFEAESEYDRSTIARYLRDVADSLESKGSITLKSGEQSLTLDVPRRLTFEVEAEREGADELSVEFELEWNESATGVELTIE